MELFSWRRWRLVSAQVVSLIKLQKIMHANNQILADTRLHLHLLKSSMAVPTLLSCRYGLKSFIVMSRQIDASDFVLGSVKARRRNRTSDKRVVIDESPPTVRKISPYSRLASGLMSYQRPSVQITTQSRYEYCKTFVSFLITVWQDWAIFVTQQ